MGRGSELSGALAVLVADPSRARRELGWEPGYTALEPIVETAWAWMCKRARAPDVR
ncbi:MAG: hypothetical protein NUV94_04705 [Candidatus Acetothermia bacterium]|nr:hypothetical protein [Candidatus Acetothermia bacterium]